MLACSVRSLLVLAVLLAPHGLLAQGKKGKLPRLKPGDKVIVDWAGEQIGEFVEYTGTGWLRVRVKASTGMVQTPVFPPDDVRLPPKEATRPTGGDGPRTWVDITGKFKTEATFLRLQDDQVELRKADGTIAKLPLARLSVADQELAKKLAAADAARPETDDPFATAPAEEGGTPAEPAGTPASHTDTQNPAGLTVTDPDWTGDSEVLLNDAIKIGGLVPDPQAAVPISLPDRGVPLFRHDSRSVGIGPGTFETPKAFAILPANDQILIAHVNEPPGTERMSRLERIDMAGSKSLGSVILEGNSVPLGVDPSGQFLVARSDNFHIGTHGRVDVFDVSQSEPKHHISWLPYGDRDWGQRDVQFACFLDKERLCTLDGGGKLTVWEFAKAKALYSISTWQGAIPAISGTGKYLAVLTKAGVYVLESATGKPLAQFEGELGASPRLSFRPDGQQLACVSSGIIQVWDVAFGKLVHDVYLPSQSMVESVSWPSDGYLLLNGGSLVDLARRIVLCQYSGGSRHGVTAGGQQFSVVKGANDADTLIHAALPHRAATQLAASLDPDALLAIKPGAQVSIRVAVSLAPQEQQRIYDALAKRLADSGIQVVQNSNITLHATTEQGKTETVQYRTFGRGFGGTQSATVTQQIQKLTYTENGKTLWQTSHVKGAPIFLHTRGKELNAALAEHVKPEVAFFVNTRVPTHLARPGEHDVGAYSVARFTKQGVQ